jgi:hypothetical protein
MKEIEIENQKIEKKKKKRKKKYGKAAGKHFGPA